MIHHHYVVAFDISVDYPALLQRVKCCGQLKVHKSVRMYQSLKLKEISNALLSI